jgi:hypothetical protein
LLLPKIVGSNDNKMMTVEDFDRYSLSEESTEPQEKSHEEKLQTWLGRITENCQQILKAIFFYQEPIESLMEKLGWKNKHTAANQQYKCIQQVKKEKLREQGE